MVSGCIAFCDRKTLEMHIYQTTYFKRRREEYLKKNYFQSSLVFNEFLFLKKNDTEDCSHSKLYLKSEKGRKRKKKKKDNKII